MALWICDAGGLLLGEIRTGLTNDPKGKDNEANERAGHCEKEKKMVEEYWWEG